MKVDFSVEIFEHTITSSIDIPEYDLESVSEENQYDFICEYITNEINNNMQLIIDDTTK